MRWFSFRLLCSLALSLGACGLAASCGGEDDVAIAPLPSPGETGGDDGSRVGEPGVGSGGEFTGGNQTADDLGEGTTPPPDSDVIDGDVYDADASSHEDTSDGADDGTDSTDDATDGTDGDSTADASVDGTNS